MTDGTPDWTALDTREREGPDLPGRNEWRRCANALQARVQALEREVADKLGELVIEKHRGLKRIAALERERDSLIAEVKGLGIVYYDDGVVPGLRNERAEVLERKNATLRNAWQTSESDRVSAVKRAEALEREVARLKGALEMIAGRRQCVDNLMSNVDIAVAALGRTEGDTT